MPETLIPADVRHRLKGLSLIARRAVGDRGIGLHASHSRGTGLEFAQYRPYEFGDEPRQIDWKLYARSDRFFVREAERESPVALWILLDASASMAQADARRAGFSRLDAGKGLVAALADGDAVVSTSRVLTTGGDAAASLDIAVAVSRAVVEVVQGVVARTTPRFVVAKGGITSSDVARHGLGIRRAVVRGPLLPGLVSLWEPVEGPAAGVPYVVFAGNVGDDGSLLAVVRTLSATP